MSWVAAGVATVQVGYGIYQQQKGASDARKAEANRPKYQIPLSLRQAMMTSELRSLEGLPGDVKNEMRQQMDRSRMSSLSQINERRGGLGAIAQLEQKQQDSIRQVGLMDTQQRNQNLQNLQQMRGQMAQQEQQAWQWDKAQRYQAAAGAASAMQGAGLQNIAGGVTSIATVAASGALQGKKGKDTTTETDISDSIAARDERAGQYTIKPQDMQFKGGEWVPKEGAMSPYGETWNDKTGGWRDDAQVASYVDDSIEPNSGDYYPVQGNIPIEEINKASNAFMSGELNTAATQYGVSVNDIEEINGTFYPKDETIKETEDGTMVWSSDSGKWESSGEDTPNISTEEVITEGGEVEIIDLNNNGVPDEREITNPRTGEVHDSKDGTILVTAEEAAATNNNNDQINTALENSENIDLATDESSLKGQVSEANQVAAAKNYGVDRSNLELKDGNWVPKEGAVSIYGDTWDSSIGGWRDDATTEGLPTTTSQENLITTEGVATEGVATEGVATEGVATEGVATEGVATEEVATEEVATEEVATTTWRDNTEIDSKRVDKFSVQGSDGENKANILKNGKPITAKISAGLATVTGVRAEGNDLIVDVELTIAAQLASGEKSGPRSMGKFVKSGDGYKFEPNKDIYGELKGEDKKDFDAFIKAVESDPEFAKQLLASVTGTNDFNPSEYGTK